MKTRAEIVIVGGGIVGVSVAWHLAQKNRKDVVLLEKGEIASGESSHAAGLVTQFATSQAMLKWRMYSVELYGKLGLFETVGGLRVASSREQLVELKRAVSKARALGLDCGIISREEALKIMPQISGENLHGAVYLPKDGQVDPYTTTTTMARLAAAAGVEIRTHERLTGIELGARSEIVAVLTEKGRIETGTVVNAAGMWAPRVAAMAGVGIPTTPVDHQHLALRPVLGHELPKDFPCLRDPDNLVYMRQEQGGLMIGGYEGEPLARWIDGAPWEHDNTTVPEDMDRFEPLLQGAIRRLPFLEQAGVIGLVCHPGAYTPDSQPLLGPVPGARGLWIAAGMSLNGYGGAGGIGKVMADWIADGEPGMDIQAYKATRFGDYYADPGWAAERTREGVRYYYRLKFPHDEHEWGRPHRVSPLHGRLQERGAVFGEKFGWERVNYCLPGQPSRMAGADQRQWGWARPPFFDRVGEEHRATREAATLYDLTSFGKIEVSGPGALGLLQKVADSDIDKPVGTPVYTQLLNPLGGIEADLTITRLANDRFRVVTGSGFVANDLAWLRMHADGGDVTFADVTRQLATLALWGPRARTILEQVTKDDVSNAGLPYYMSREVGIGPARVLAQRVSYVGELGWELYVEPAHAVQVWDRLVAAGRDHGLEFGGYKALDSLRLEKGYRYYTTDITRMETPYEGGLGFCVSPDKPDFIGKAALKKQKEEGITRKLCTLTVQTDGFTQIYGGEALELGGKVLSRVRSGGWGYTVRKNIILAYLPVELAKPGASFDLDLIDGRIKATVGPTALHDPKGDRLRS